MMTSDGFSCIYDRYNIFNKDEIVQIGEKNGIKYIGNKIREIERKDNNGILYPRFKESDDSSCIYLKIRKK